MSIKLTYDYVKSFIEKEGYQLLSKEYKNNYTKLLIKCPVGHEYKVKFNDFQHGIRCPICNGKQKFTYDYVKDFIEKEGYPLLSDTYINANTKLLLKCPKYHEYKVSFGSFKQGGRCLICSGKQKFTYDYVKDYIEKEGYQLLSKEYINNSTKLLLKCLVGHEYKVSFNHFYNRNQRCPVCWYESKSSKQEKELQDYIESLGYNIVRNDRTQIINPLTGKNLELDIWIPDKNKAIEYNGNHWHKKLYMIEKDKIKLYQCRRKGIDLLIVNDYNWINCNKFEKEIIKKWVKK